jgi:hypothetical protein
VIWSPTVARWLRQVLLAVGIVLVGSVAVVWTVSEVADWLSGSATNSGTSAPGARTDAEAAAWLDWTPDYQDDQLDLVELRRYGEDLTEGLSAVSGRFDDETAILPRTRLVQYTCGFGESCDRQLLDGAEATFGVDQFVDGPRSALSAAGWTVAEEARADGSIEAFSSDARTGLTASSTVSEVGPEQYVLRMMWGLPLQGSQE